MEERHEIIHFSDKIPAKIFIHKLGNVSKHWHESLELLFVLTGEVNAVIDDRSYELKSTDIILINSHSIHELNADECEMVALQINLQSIDLYNEYANTNFDCCSARSIDNTRFDNIRYFLARLIKTNEKGENPFLSHAIIFLLINELITNFQGTKKPDVSDTKKNMDRLSNIIRYINDHFREGISIKDIADNQHFSIPYLSRFFKKYMRINFSDYYNNIRLEHAVNELLSSDESISTIAVNNGFSDSRSFVSLFKNRYDTLPSTYRTENKSPVSQPYTGSEINYLAITNSSALANLAKYLNINTEINSSNVIRAQDFIRNIDIGTLPVSTPGKKLKHNYRKLCCVGSTRDLLFGEVQQMLTRLQKEVHFEYIKFHGLLSDDMMVYSETTGGIPTLSFVLIDKVLDFLRSIDLKPLIQLSFMPKMLASDPNKTSFFIDYNTSPPSNMNKWLALVQALTIHLMERYGTDEVITWPFCVWNEPDTSVKMFGFESKDLFFDFYHQTYKTVKEIDSRIIFGSPSLLLLSEDPFQWYHPFFDFCYNNDCMPQFINLHYYEDNLDALDFKTIKVSYLNKLNTDEDAFAHFLDHLFDSVESYHIKDIPVYMTEWNLTVNHRNLINDTCYKACYITKNLLENYDRLNSFGYWSLTDFISELQPSEQLYHGGLGLFTINGIPKAPYNVYCFFAKLGDELLSSGKGWFVTRSSNSGNIQLLLYNYTHYSDLFASGEIFDMTSVKRYTSFSKLDPVSFTLDLQGLPSEQCLIREFFINREHGSSFDAWVQMGAMSLTTRDEYEILNSNSLPGMYMHQALVENSSLKLLFKLEPLEVRFVEILPTQLLPRK